jgi:hypothetical protein
VLPDDQGAQLQQIVKVRLALSSGELVRMHAEMPEVHLRPPCLKHLAEYLPTAPLDRVGFVVERGGWCVETVVQRPERLQGVCSKIGSRMPNPSRVNASTSGMGWIHRRSASGVNPSAPGCRRCA